MNNQTEHVRQKTVGLSFSGGGVQAWSEVAVYADLERQGIEVDAVAGTSMGSFLAAAVASGLSSEEIYDMIQETDHAIDKSKLFGTQAFFSLFSLRRPMGLVLMDKLAEVIRPVSKLYEEVMLSDVPKPLAIPAVDIISKRLIVFSNQPEYFRNAYEDAVFYEEDIPLVKACLASSAYPIILSPVKVDGYQLVDGGVLMNSPASLFSKEKIEHVLAIRIPVLENTDPVGKRMDVALRAISVMIEEQEEISTLHADQQYFVDIHFPGTFEFGDSGTIIDAGIEYLKANPVDTSEMFERVETEKSSDLESVEDVKIIIEPLETTGQKLDKMLWKIKSFFKK